MDKPFSQSCENNKQPILAVLEKIFAKSRNVLEIGSGTGQHAVHFAAKLKHLTWHTSDMPDRHPGIQLWLEESKSENLRYPLAFTVGIDSWPKQQFDGVFTANSTHIMQPLEAKQMMTLVADNVPSEGVFCQYGPFNIDGQYTSEGNRKFDAHLMNEGCGGIRDIDELRSWAKDLTLIEQIPMPANNFMLVWRKY